MLRAVWVALLAVWFTPLAAADQPGRERPVIVNAVPVPLYPDEPERRDLGELVYRGGLELRSTDPAFGGFSALAFNADGTRLIALSDRAQWLTADLVLDEASVPTGLENVRMAPLLGPDGQPWAAGSADSEGLAYLGDGVWLVSFEGNHRVEAYAIGPEGEHIATSRPQALARPPVAADLPRNASLEALAIQSGHAWAGVEHSSLDGVHALYRYDLGDLQRAPDIFRLRLMPGFGLVSLAEMGDGRLLAVERFYARGIGNRIRVSVVTENLITGVPGSPPARLLALFTPTVTVDNLEGAAFTMLDGRPTLFLISDDNFSQTQRTLLLSFELAD